MRAPFVSVHPILGMPDAGNGHVGPSPCGPESGSCRQPRTLNTAVLRLRYAHEATLAPASPDVMVDETGAPLAGRAAALRFVSGSAARAARGRPGLDSRDQEAPR